MSKLARAERLRLVSAARRAGPDAPTLCEGWTTRDLATHLVIRERHPAAAMGILSSRFANLREHQEQEYASMPYSELLGLVAAPPRWSPGGWPGTEALMNTSEYLVHHEDIRRAEYEWFPRRLSQQESAAVWSQVRVALIPFASKTPGRVEVVSPGFGDYASGSVALGRALRRGGMSPVRRGGSSSPSTTTTITGEPVEVLLYLMGREKHALVDVRTDG